MPGKITAERWDKIRWISVLCGTVPFFYLEFFSHGDWVRPAIFAYLLTALLFGVLLDYPPPSSAWFWKAMMPIVAFHAIVVVAILKVTFAVPAINHLPRIVLGFVGVVLMLEWRLAIWIINACEPKKSRDRSGR